MKECTTAPLLPQLMERERGKWREALWQVGLLPPAFNSPSLFKQNFSLPTATCAKKCIISDFCFKWKTNKRLLFLKATLFQSRDLWCGLKSSGVRTYRLNSENYTLLRWLMKCLHKHGTLEKLNESKKEASGTKRKAIFFIGRTYLQWSKQKYVQITVKLLELDTSANCYRSLGRKVIQRKIQHSTKCLCNLRANDRTMAYRHSPSLSLSNMH